MNFSVNYIIYPESRGLERAIASSIGMLGDEAVAAAVPDTQVAVADKLLYTRGRYEYHPFRSQEFHRFRAVL